MSKSRFVASAAALAWVLGASGLWGVQAFPRQPDGTSEVGQRGRVYEATDEGVSLPQVVKDFKPSYTTEARNARIEGTMAVAVVVETDGQVEDVRVTRSLDQTYGLDEEGIKAARQWRFRPGTKDGKAVAVRVTLEFTFVLK